MYCLGILQFYTHSFLYASCTCKNSYLVLLQHGTMCVLRRKPARLGFGSGQPLAGQVTVALTVCNFEELIEWNSADLPAYLKYAVLCNVILLVF